MRRSLLEGGKGLVLPCLAFLIVPVNASASDCPSCASATTTINVTVSETQPLAVAPLPDIQIECPINIPRTEEIAPTISGGVQPYSMTWSESSNGGTGGSLIITQTVTVTDAAGNTASATRTVEVSRSGLPSSFEPPFKDGFVEVKLGQTVPVKTKVDNECIGSTPFARLSVDENVTVESTRVPNTTDALKCLEAQCTYTLDVGQTLGYQLGRYIAKVRFELPRSASAIVIGTVTGEFEVTK